MLELEVRNGELPAEAWVYAWVARDGVVYVGATALHPATRTWLHLNDERPEVGRMRARFPTVASESLDVVALPLPAGTDRQQVRHGAVTALGERGLLSPRHVCDAPLDTPPHPETERFVGMLAEQLASAR